MPFCRFHQYSSRCQYDVLGNYPVYSKNDNMTVLEGPAIRTAIVTKERCEPAGRELVSVRVQAGAKSVVPA